MSEVDQWGGPVAAGQATSLVAWDRAWTETLRFSGEPFATLQQANSDDEEFCLGSVYCGTYRVLGASPLDDAALAVDLQRATARARSPRELGHTEALKLLAAGEFTAAAARWDDIACDRTDLAAVRFAHDVYLHVGDHERRLASSSAAMAAWEIGRPGWNHVAGMHAFSLEEAGFYEGAEALGWEALNADSLDAWALHALAHVYEMRDDNLNALGLLRGRQVIWSGQSSLSTHIWWHLCLRLIAADSYDEVISIYDRLEKDPRTPYRFCDLASLLWRLELAGFNVEDRWESLVASVDAFDTHHTSAFVELHLALVYSRAVDGPSAEKFFTESRSSHEGEHSENSETFRLVVEPLIDAIRSTRSNPSAALANFESVGASLHRVGGSVAQRDIIPLTRKKLETT